LYRLSQGWKPSIVFQRLTLEDPFRNSKNTTRLRDKNEQADKIYGFWLSQPFFTPKSGAKHAITP
jgi:hypothetical protein